MWRVPGAARKQRFGVGFILMTSGLSVQCAPTAECSLARAASLRGGRGEPNTVSIANESDQVTKEHLVDALAVRGEEGRGTLR